MQAIRQLNLLIDRQYSPIDVFSQVKVAVQYATLLLGENVPDTPSFECCKTPSDVYRRMLECFALVDQIARKRNVKMLKLSISKDEIVKAVPSEVYYFVSLLISELAHLNRLKGNTQTFEIQYAGRKFPSHVYQQVGILEGQLRKLLR